MQDINDIEDRSYGCMLGAFIGDSIGQYLEFEKGVQKKEKVDLGMSMPGGGTWNLAPGQITDDSELAMCQLRGLVEGNGILNTACIAKYYGQWFADGPFDSGGTCRNGIKGINVRNPKAKDAIRSAQCYNTKSQSNGSLMKCTPIAVWSQNLETKDALRAVDADVIMIHSNFDVSQVIGGYCLAIKYLLNNPTE